MLFGFSVGINVRILAMGYHCTLKRLSQGTNNIFLKTPKPEGYGFSQFAVAGCYGTPVVSTNPGLNAKKWLY